MFDRMDATLLADPEQVAFKLTDMMAKAMPRTAMRDLTVVNLTAASPTDPAATSRTTAPSGTAEVH